MHPNKVINIGIRWPTMYVLAIDNTKIIINFVVRQSYY